LNFIDMICSPGVVCQTLVGLSRTVILFIVASGLSLILGVLRIPNVAHGSLYMIGAFMAFSVSSFFGGGATGFWMALALAPLGVMARAHDPPRRLATMVRERLGNRSDLLAYELDALDRARYGVRARRRPDPAWWQRFSFEAARLRRAH